MRVRSEGWTIVRMRGPGELAGGVVSLSLPCTEMIDWARDCVFALLRGLRAGARAFLMGEVVVPFLLWAREDGFALPDWERVVVAIAIVRVFGGVGGVVGEVVETVLSESGNGRKLPAAVE